MYVRISRILSFQYETFFADLFTYFMLFCIRNNVMRQYIKNRRIKLLSYDLS